MITIQNDSPVFVGQTNGVELTFTNSGSWVVTHVTGISAGTNATTELSGLRDGAVITVDAGGLINVSNGPDITSAAMRGFAWGMGTLGVAIVITYAIIRLMRIARVEGVE